MKNKFVHKFTRGNEVFWVEDLEQDDLSVYTDTGIKSLNIGKDKFASIKRPIFDGLMNNELKGFEERKK